MAFFSTDTSSDALKETSFEYIDTSGIYDVIIDTISVSTNEKGARSLNLNVDYKGSKTVLYGLRLDNNDGSANFGRAIFNKLCIIAGIEEVDDPETQTHMLGKEKTPTDLQVLDQFSDLAIKVRILVSYSRYKGKIQERKDIRGFYRAEDGATANEIINGIETGQQLIKDIPHSQEPKYSDGVTAEEVEAWKQAKSSKNIPTETKAQATTPKANPFAK